MTTLTGALCRGLHLAPLFESTHPSNHAEAAAICGAGTATECPAFGACGAMARELEAGPLDHRPVGTWAGVLYGVAPVQASRRGRTNPREHGTERGYYQHRWLGEPPCGPCLSVHYEMLGERFGVTQSAQVRATIRTRVRVESDVKRGPDRANESDPLATNLNYQRGGVV